MNIGDDDDFSDHEVGVGVPNVASPTDRTGAGLGFGLGFGSPPPSGGGYPAFGNASVEGQSPFDNLSELMVHHAHLAVFLNYVISNSDPAALVSELINKSITPLCQITTEFVF